MENITLGIFEYFDDLSPQQYSVLPESLHLNTASTEAVLLRLFLGKLALKDDLYPSKIIKQKYNYTILPYQSNKKITKKTLSNIFNTDVSVGDGLHICNRYFLRNRRNIFVHERLLNEISYYFFEDKVSPISAFVHLYRCLEFMSYSFPMIYASSTRDYKGSFEALKKFLNSNNIGELGFFRNFIAELFKDEDTILTFPFEMNITSPRIDDLKNECNAVLRHECAYDFEGSVMFITFSNMISLFTGLRNRYFHMLIGQSRNNFNCVDFDISDLFRSLNPFFLNWIAIIFSKIVQLGFKSSLL